MTGRITKLGRSFARSRDYDAMGERRATACCGARQRLVLHGGVPCRCPC